MIVWSSVLPLMSMTSTVLLPSAETNSFLPLVPKWSKRPLMFSSGIASVKTSGRTSGVAKLS